MLWAYSYHPTFITLLVSSAAKCPSVFYTERLIRFLLRTYKCLCFIVHSASCYSCFPWHFFSWSWIILWPLLSKVSHWEAGCRGVIILLYGFSASSSIFSVLALPCMHGLLLSSALRVAPHKGDQNKQWEGSLRQLCSLSLTSQTNLRVIFIYFV